MEAEWVQTPEGWKKIFDLTQGLGKVNIRYKNDINPDTKDTNVSREKSTLAKFFNVNQDTDILWLSKDDMFMLEDVRYYDDKKKNG